MKRALNLAFVDDVSVRSVYCRCAGGWFHNFCPPCCRFLRTMFGVH